MEEGEKGRRDGIPFRTPFCLVSFPSHVRHRVYNSFLVTPMGLHHGLVPLRKGPLHEIHALARSSGLKENITSSEIHTRRIWRS